MIRIRAIIDPEFRLRLSEHGTLEPGTRRQLRDVIDKRSKQAAKGLDVPWCFFDLSEAHLYLGNPEAARTLLAQGRRRYNSHQLETFNTSLKSLQQTGIILPGLTSLQLLVATLAG